MADGRERWRAGHSAILGKRNNPLIPNAEKRSTPSAAGFSFSLSSGKGEKKEHPVNPVNPV
ncbi:MAG: hypothetical protein R6T98_14885 [Desulfatiglandales bacterium]